MSDDRRYWLMTRKQIEVNTDPQRRCYNGCHFSSEMQSTDWERLYMTTKEDGEASIKTFKSINPTREYKLEEV